MALIKYDDDFFKKFFFSVVISVATHCHISLPKNYSLAQLYGEKNMM